MGCNASKSTGTTENTTEPKPAEDHGDGTVVNDLDDQATPAGMEAEPVPAAS